MESITAPSQQALATEAQTWASRAKGLRIVDAESCKNVSFLLRSIKGVRSDIARWFEPHIEAAMETKRKAESARKALVDEQARMEAPLVEAEGVCKRALLTWEADQERTRLAEEKRLQDEARQRAEALTLEAAAAMEREAAQTGDAGMLAEAQSILEQPIEAPVVSVARMVPKVEGVSYRSTFKAHPTIDVKALAGAVAAGTAPVSFLIPNMTAINQFARATQGGQPVPGVKFYEDRSIAAHG